MAASTPGSEAASLRQGSTTVTGQSGISVDARPATTRTPTMNRDKTMTSAQVAAPARLTSEVVTRVLIADDDTVVRDVVRRYLERDGLEVAIAHDGTRGAAAARHRSASTSRCST